MSGKARKGDSIEGYFIRRLIKVEKELAMANKEISRLQVYEKNWKIMEGKFKEIRNHR